MTLPLPLSQDKVNIFERFHFLITSKIIYEDKFESVALGLRRKKHENIVRI